MFLNKLRVLCEGFLSFNGIHLILYFGYEAILDCDNQTSKWETTGA